VSIARVLRDAPEFKFTFLAELTAVDYWPREPRFDIVYVLVSLEHKLRVRMKVRLPGSDPHLATVSAIWSASGMSQDRTRHAQPPSDRPTELPLVDPAAANE